MLSLHQFFRSVSFVSLMTCITLFTTMSVEAQQNREASLETKIDRLERQLKAVQRKVFQGGDSRFFPEDGSQDIIEQPLDAPQSGNNLLADLEIRVGAIERRLREVTGQIEESDFKVRQLTEEFSRYREDLEFRLAVLERGGAQSADAGTEVQNGDLNSPQAQQDTVQNSPQDGGAPALIPSRSTVTDPKESFDEAFKLMSQGLSLIHI